MEKNVHTAPYSSVLFFYCLITALRMLQSTEPNSELDGER